KFGDFIQEIFRFLRLWSILMHTAQLNVPSFSAPQFDDEEDEMDLLTVKQDTSAGLRASQNFLNSLAALTSQ
ncbi:MAG: hypothetical protein AAFR67_00730, partial [Chloroflexota bacterium]